MRKFCKKIALFMRFYLDPERLEVLPVGPRLVQPRPTALERYLRRR